MIVRLDGITRSMVRANRDALFVFGDNMARAGYGGQAAAMRGEPNTIGIPTKWRPSYAPDAYFTDDDWDRVIPTIDRAIHSLAQHLAAGGTVVVPKAGVGSGRAALAESAPRIKSYIDDALNALEKHDVGGEAGRRGD